MTCLLDEMSSIPDDRIQTHAFERHFSSTEDPAIVAIVGNPTEALQ